MHLTTEGFSWRQLMMSWGEVEVLSGDLCHKNLIPHIPAVSGVLHPAGHTSSVSTVRLTPAVNDTVTIETVFQNTHTHTQECQWAGKYGNTSTWRALLHIKPSLTVNLRNAFQPVEQYW